MNSRPCPQIRSGTRVLGHQRCPPTPARPVEDRTAANRSKNNRRRCIPGGSRGLDSQYGVAGTRDSKIWAQLDRRHGAIVVPLSTTALRWRLGPERRASPGGPPSARRGTGSSVGAPVAGRNSFAPRGGGPLRCGRRRSSPPGRTPRNSRRQASALARSAGLIGDGRHPLPRPHHERGSSGWISRRWPWRSTNASG
jgi:hypothetical protein